MWFPIWALPSVKSASFVLGGIKQGDLHPSYRPVGLIATVPKWTFRTRAHGRLTS